MSSLERAIARFWHYRLSRQMNFFVAPSVGHDDYVVSAALTVQAANDIETRPRVARGRLPVD